MEKRNVIMQILFLFQVIFLASSQELNIKRIGGANFANVNVFSGYLNEDVIAFMSTSGLPNSNQKILYDIANNDDFKTIHNGTQIINMTEFYIYTNTSLPTNYTYKSFSGQSYFYDGTWYSIMGKNYLEMFGFEGTYDYISLEDYFGFQGFVEFGDIVKFETYHSDYTYHSHIFPFIVETGNSTKIVLISIISGDLLEFNSSRVVFQKECGKSKVISCFTNHFPEEMLICLYRTMDNLLEAILLNQRLEEEGKTFLSTISNSSENENMFFKGITLNNDTSVIAYYTGYKDEYLRIGIKKLDYDEYNYPILFNYTNNSILLIDATRFNKHYLLNDLVKLDNGDIYFAASSDDRETLYIVILKLNETSINKRIITINLFEDYKLKFYNDLKLVSYLNSVALGFSHCNSQKCEEKTYHSTSLTILNEIKEDFDFDLIQNLYDSNYNKSSPIIVDLNVYKKNIFGLKFKSITFLDIHPGLGLFIPGNNSEEVEVGLNYDFSSFRLNISLNATGKFYISYTLTMEDSDSVSSSNLRRLVTEEKTVHFYINIDKAISNSCDDKCSLCSSTDRYDCVSCKYDYSFVGNKKYCFDKNGDMNMSQIGDLYDNVVNNIAEQNYMTVEKENVVLQLTTVEDQLTNNSQYVSSIDLGECETLLRVQEGIDDNEQFIIVKMDLKNNSISATYVQYELYNPQTLQKVSMDICKDVTIKIHTPVTLEESQFSLISSLEESGYNAFDLKDDFYNDICSTYTAENGADIVLSFRKSLIYDQNKDTFLCQSGCEFESYSTKNGKAECNCKVQSESTQTDITKISFDKAKLADSFYKTLFNSNFRVLKCVKLLFSSKGLKSNYGNYLMDVLLGLFIAFIVLHLLTGQKKIMEIINSALKSKGIGEIKNDSPKENKEEKTMEKNYDKKEEDNKKEVENEVLKNNVKTVEAEDNQDRKKKKRKSSKRHKSKEKDKNIDEPQFPPKKRKSRKSKEIKTENVDGILVNTKTDLVNKKDQVNETDMKEKKKDNHHNENKEEKPNMEDAKGLNDQELNTLDYEIACDIDHRTYFQYYFSLLKKKHLILFTFWPMDDYNLAPMKILLFIVSFSLYFTINAFFFTDETMNKIYEDDAAFNFIYQLPQIFYSSVISAVINMILKMLSLSEKKVLEIKKEKNADKAKEKADKIKKQINITLIIFIILSSLLMLFFWYFISCFCAVYENTQSVLISDTLISFILSMLYPFALNLLPGLFRIPALRAPNKDQKYKYTISGYVALI